LRRRARFPRLQTPYFDLPTRLAWGRKRGRKKRHTQTEVRGPRFAIFNPRGKPPGKAGCGLRYFLFYFVLLRVEVALPLERPGARDFSAWNVALLQAKQAARQGRFLVRGMNFFQSYAISSGFRRTSTGVGRENRSPSRRSGARAGRETPQWLALPRRSWELPQHEFVDRRTVVAEKPGRAPGGNTALSVTRAATARADLVFARRGRGISSGPRLPRRLPATRWLRAVPPTGSGPTIKFQIGHLESRH